MEVLPVKQSSIRSFFPPRTNLSSNQIPEPEPPEQEPDEIKVPQKEAEDSSRLPKAVISFVGPQHIQPLKRINTLLLPITYPDNFYTKILSPDVNLSYVILWNSPRPSNSSKNKVYTIHKEQQVIGGIVCRLEQYPELNSSSVYIQSLALLSPYRSQGLAAALLDTVIRTIVQLPSLNPAPSSLYAHVWTENTEALTWYKARGFIADPAPIQNYYSRLRPGTAFLLRRTISPSDYLRHKSSVASPTTSKRSSKRSSEDWEMVESPDVAPKPVSAPASLPFIASPPLCSYGPPQKSNKQSTKPAQTYLNFPPAPPPANVPNTTSNPAVSPSMPAAPPRPEMIPHTASFQNRAPDREWNDLPLDLLGAPNKTALSRTTSTTDTGVAMGGSTPNSRSSSSSRTTGKKKRHYPPAAFGSAGSDAAQ